MENKKIIFLSTGALLFGILFFFLYNKWILVSFAFPTTQKGLETKAALQATEKKVMPIWYWHRGKLKSDKRQLLWKSNSPIFNIECIVRSWLGLIDSERIINKSCSLQDAALSSDNQELFLSFDCSIFNPESSAYEKFMLIKSLLKTIQEAGMPIKAVRFLVHHQILEDAHIDFTFPWALTFGQGSGHDFELAGFSEDTEPVNLIEKNRLKNRPFTIVLDPSGDAQNSGRIIGDSFERGLTLQLFQAVRDILEMKLPDKRIILTRLSGETVEKLQNASFSNKLQADLYVNINFYPETNLSNQLYVYYYIAQPEDLFSKVQPSKLEFCQYNQAHLENLINSLKLAKITTKILNRSSLASKFSIIGPVAFPFKPLVGVKAPAIALEIGIKGKEDWRELVQEISQLIFTLINQ